MQQPLFYFKLIYKFLGGLLFVLGIIPTLLESMDHLFVNPSRATICVVLTGKTFKPIYDKLGLHSKNLSRILEDADTVINPLIPWGVCGVFITNVLGVRTLTCLPFSFFYYLMCNINNYLWSYRNKYKQEIKNGDPDVA